MAITKTTKVQRIEVYPPADSSAADSANAKHETIMVVYEDTLDDSADAELPVTAIRTKILVSGKKMVALLLFTQMKTIL